jgi:hypothetical protein
MGTTAEPIGSMKNSPYATLKHGLYTLPLKPPFSFEGMTARVFPLRANLDSLQRLCDSYLNFGPAEAGRFRAVIPYAYLMMLDYGRLAVQAANVGWLSQREIFFCVPVEWYRVINGQWIFQDWAVMTPFIYVDDDLSVPLGRIVYGWPKTMAKLTPTLSAWMRDPSAPVNEATASAMVFPELYQGRKLEQQVFLEVERSAPMSNFQLPGDTATPIAPWVMASNMASAMAGYGRDAVSMLAGLGLVPMHPGSNVGNFNSMINRISDSTFPFQPGIVANTINLKQFRKTDRPDEYCYQSLTNGPMRVTAFNRGGMLGEDRMLLGDSTGGYSIKLHDWPTAPIVQTLGLEVERRWRGDGSDVVLIKPVSPFWYDVNMEYLPGTNLAWRAHDGLWRNGSGLHFVGQPSSKAEVPVDDLLFNTTVGSAVDSVAGPFQFSGTTIRVMPLIARRAALRVFLKQYLNDNVEGARERYELWDAPPRPGKNDEFAYVYMTASSFGDVTSKTNNVGDWAEYELAFMIPVRRMTFDGTVWTTCGVGVVPAFTYVDGTTAAVARTEVLGIPTSRAVFTRPESAWMASGYSDGQASQMLLRVDAEILPAVGEGQKARMQTIVDIGLADPMDASDVSEDKFGAERWGTILLNELERKKALKAQIPDVLNHARALALDLLADRTAFSVFTLKQFRDVADPDTACYQGLIDVRRVLDEAVDVQEIEARLNVRIHEFPTQAVVDTLGLVGKTVRDDGAGIVYVLQPVRPFTLRVKMTEELGQLIASRSGTLEWGGKEDVTEPILSLYKIDSMASPLVPPAVRMQDQGDPRRMVKAVRDAKRAAGSPDETPPSLGRALRVMGELDPQSIIESILSREWGSWNPKARWQQGRAELQKAYDETLMGIDAGRLAVGELAFFTAIVQAAGKRPGETPVVTSAAAMVARLGALSTTRTSLEQHWAILAQWGVERLYGKAAGGSSDASPNELDVLNALTAFLNGVIAINDLQVIGECGPRLDGGDYAARDNQSRLAELTERIFEPLTSKLETILASFAATAPPGPSAPDYTITVEEVWRVRDDCRRAVELIRERCDLQRDAVLNKLSRMWQKPDYCVRRDSVGTGRDRLFPKAESWDDEWYYGPSVYPPSIPHVDGSALPSSATPT